MFLDGNDLKADIEILKTPSGMILKGLLDANVQVFFRTSGTGHYTVDEKSVTTVTSYEFMQIFASYN